MRTKPVTDHIKVFATAASGLLLAVGISAGNAAASDSGSASAAPAAHTSAASVHPDSRCLVWWKETANYAGMTAGYSWAWNVTVSPGATGDRVKEIQCLTDYHGQGPSALDGVYGPATVAAVKRTQARCQFPPSQQDGIAGPHTWSCLRIEE